MSNAVKDKIAELQSQQKKIDEELQVLLKTTREEKRQELLAEIRLYKFTAKELELVVPNVPNVIAGESTGQVQGDSSKKGTRSPMKVKYRNPANPEETWVGVGREKKWVVRELAAGKKLEDFLV